MKTAKLLLVALAIGTSVIACKKDDGKTDTVPTPELNYLTPESGSPGDIVKIVGNNFSLKTNENTVNFGDVQSTIDFAYTDTLIVRVPTGAGNEVSVTVNGVAANKTLNFNYQASWVLSSLTNMASGMMQGPSTLAEATFRYPMNLCCDENGNIYVAEQCTHTIKKISIENNTVEIFAGKYIDNDEWGANTHYSDGAALEAEFNRPMDIAYAGNNTFYVADFANNAIRKISNGQVTTIGQRRLNDNDWENVQMYENTDFKMSLDDFKFTRPTGLLYDKENNDLYVSSESHYVVRVDFDANEVELYAGKPFDAGQVDGARQEGKMNGPRGMAFDDAGNLYVANEYGNWISKVDKDHNLTVFAGSTNAGSKDGSATEALFNQPQYMIYFENSLLISDFKSHAIRRISIEDGTVSTWAGYLEYNDVKDGGLSECRVSYPVGLCYSYDGESIYMTQTETYEGIRVFKFE